MKYNEVFFVKADIYDCKKPKALVDKYMAYRSIFKLLSEVALLLS
jgi:hypothetical protein